MAPLPSGYPPGMNATTALLFDLDGTLVDSTYHHALAWHRSFARLGDPPPMSRIHRAVGMGGDKLVREVAGDATEAEDGDRLRDGWREEYLSLRAEVTPLPGATDLVTGLRDDGFRVAFASSGDPSFARESLALLGIDPDEVEVLVTSGDVDASKPEPDLVDEALRRLTGIDRAVFIGDTVYDVVAATRAGIPCVGLLSGGFGRAELEEAGAVLVAEEPRDLGGTDWATVTRPVG